ncbi:MAG TPA: hypothetical protein VKB78_13850 [Pirellulales bacterium]|nr:hypothetical protein [Pirellulales bacterium]
MSSTNGGDRLAALCAPLRALVDAELAAGNRIDRMEGEFGDEGAILVLLAEPFHTNIVKPSADLEYREFGCSHFWKAHYAHLPTAQIVACGFGRRDAS